MCRSGSKLLTFREGPAIPVPTLPADTTTFMSGFSAATGVMNCWAWFQGMRRPPGGRFIYLSWGTVDGVQTFTLFRRAKLWLDAIPPAVIDSALRLGLLVGRLWLTDAKGNPLCAAVRPPVIEWSAEAA